MDEFGKFAAQVQELSQYDLPRIPVKKYVPRYLRIEARTSYHEYDERYVSFRIEGTLLPNEIKEIMTCLNASEIVQEFRNLLLVKQILEE